MKVLISLLGRVQRPGSGAYQTVEYEFENGERVKAAFLGWPLARRLNPDRLIILGTATSMWDHLFEGDLDLGDTAEERRLELIHRVEADQPVTEDLLQALEPELADHLGCEVRLVIVPRGLEAQAQMEIFGGLAAFITPGDEITLDCTHGFRHMPMLLLAGAQYLEGVGRARVSGVYYGLMEPGKPVARVCRLDSLAEIDRGVRALARFDASGDYEPLLELLAPHLPAELGVKVLRRAAFHERTLRIPQARKTLERLHQFLERDPLPFPHNLLRRPLLERLAWTREETHDRRQLAAARNALYRRDYPRACALLYEAVVNRVVREDKLGDPDNAQVREQAREQVQQRLRDGRLPGTIETLRFLRNAMAHGARPVSAEAQRLLASEDELQSFLDKLIGELA